MLLWNSNKMESKTQTNERRNTKMKNIMRKAGKGLAILLAGATLATGGYFAGKYDGIQTGREQGRKAALYAVGEELKGIGKGNLHAASTEPKESDSQKWYETRGRSFYMAGDWTAWNWRTALLHLNHPDYKYPKGLADSRGRVDTNRVYEAFSAEFDKMKLE